MKWVGLAAASIAFAALAQSVRIPAAWLIAPMLVAIAASLGGIGLRLPRVTLVLSQSIIAVTIAQGLTAPVVGEIAREWVPIAAVVLSTLVAAGTAGWILARYSPLSAETAAWGSSPGAAVAMISLSGQFGADPRIVAFMQYLRVTLVVLTASLAARLFLDPSAHASPLATTGEAPFALVPFVETLAIALAAGFAGRASKLPGAQFLTPMIASAILHATGVLHIFVPWWLLDAAYVGIAWQIGLLYTRETVRFVIGIFPTLALSTLVLIAMCGGSAALLVLLLHVDPLSAYLATTPGGLDSVSIISLGTGSNVALVLAIQTLRVFLVAMTGPPLAKVISRLAGSQLAARVSERS